MGALKDGLSPEVRNNLTITDDNKLFFRDSGLFIHSDVDGSLTISVDGTSGNTVKVKLNDKSGSTKLTVYDSEGFPMGQLDSDGNLLHKGTVRRTTTN